MRGGRAVALESHKYSLTSSSTYMIPTAGNGHPLGLGAGGGAGSIRDKITDQSRFIAATIEWNMTKNGTRCSYSQRRRARLFRHGVVRSCAFWWRRKAIHHNRSHPNVVIITISRMVLVVVHTYCSSGKFVSKTRTRGGRGQLCRQVHDQVFADAFRVGAWDITCAHRKRQ